MLRGGVYREVLRPRSDGVTIRARKGETVRISGAEVIDGWTRETDGNWSAKLDEEPEKILRDGQAWEEFIYDRTARRITLKGGDPRLHIFETVAREQGIELGGKTRVKLEEITVTNTSKATK